MEQLKQHAILSAVIAGITIAILQAIVGPVMDFIFSMLLIGLIIVVARLARRQ